MPRPLLSLPWLFSRPIGSRPYSPGAVGAAPLMIPRIAITLASAGILCSHLVTVSERCAQRIERQQLNRAALMVSVEQGAQ